MYHGFFSNFISMILYGILCFYWLYIQSLIFYSIRRNEVARKLYILGKSTILDLNASISEKDSARRNYVSALYNYWSLYYTLRSMTLYDFERNEQLTEDYNLLIE